MNALNDKPNMKVYYNSACPVCKAGINWQMKKDSLCEIAWKDVHTDNQVVSDVGSDLEFVRKRLHVVDEHGELHIGFDAFLAIWRNTPSEQWKASILGLPGIRQLCGVIYNLFAERLYQWNRSKQHWL